MTKASLKSLVTLIVDDDGMMRSYLRLMLKEAGLDNIAEASSGQTARRLVKQRAPKLILLDINLPDVDGVEYLKEVMSEHPACHVVMVSAEGTLDRVKTAIANGAKGFVVKPFNTETVLKQLRTIVSDLDTSMES